MLCSEMFVPRLRALLVENLSTFQKGSGVITTALVQATNRTLGSAGLVTLVTKKLEETLVWLCPSVLSLIRQKHGRHTVAETEEPICRSRLFVGECCAFITPHIVSLLLAVCSALSYHSGNICQSEPACSVFVLSEQALQPDAPERSAGTFLLEGKRYVEPGPELVS